MAGGFLALLIVTYSYICFSVASSKARASPSAAYGMLPYRPIFTMDPTASAADLCPCIIHAGPLD